MSCGVDQVEVARRHRVLPDQVFGGNLGAEVAHLGPHVAVGELEPGAREGIGELVRVLEEAARDLLVGRVHACSAMSVVSIIGAWRFEGSCASGTVPWASAFFGVHCQAPAGLLVSSQS